MNLRTPRVGDRVKIGVAIDPSGGDYYGMTGKVLQACPPEYEVVLDGMGSGYTFYDGELEVIEKEVNGL